MRTGSRFGVTTLIGVAIVGLLGSAVAATLGVTDPYVTGTGGGAYLVYYDARTHRITTVDGRETAPAGIGPDLFIDPATGRPLPVPAAVTSGLSVGLPSTLMTWQRALEAWGRFRLADNLRPAEQVAEHGFAVTATLREQRRENAARFAQFSSTSGRHGGGRGHADPVTAPNPAHGQRHGHSHGR